MGLIAGVMIGFAVFFGINAHQSTIIHERALKKEFADTLQQKNLALARARKPKPQIAARLNGVEVADLSGESHA